MRERAAAGLLLLALALVPRLLNAQNPTPPPATGTPANPAGVTDTLKAKLAAAAGKGKLDSSTLKRLGLPAGPALTLPAPDSIWTALKKRPGYIATELMADTVQLFPGENRVELSQHAGTTRNGDIMEANHISYDSQHCLMTARGDPKMFQKAKSPVVGRQISFDTCGDRGVVTGAYTSLDQMGGNWFVSGNLAVDSSGSRLYAANSSFTSCDLPVPHYHFQAGEVKWVSNSVIVARPAVLYVRDVPVVWLPFIFQDTKPGRRSGILIPQFGFNDIVRPTRDYNRQITNVGYYWAPSDYIDLTTRLDWFANRYTQYGVTFRYKWLDKFIDDGSGISYNKQVQSGGGSSTQLDWNHSQHFDVTTSIKFSLHYVSNSQVLAGNSIDPLLTTQEIASDANLTKRFSWGTVSLGGSRRQTLSDGSGTMTLPSLTIQPKSFALSSAITWSPSLSLTNTTQFDQPLSQPFLVNATGGLDSVSTTGHSRQTTLNITSPFQFGGFSLQNSIAVNDQVTVARRSVTIRSPNLATPDPNDSISTTTIRDGSYASGIDYNFNFNLPLLARPTFKITPSIGVTNTTTGPLFLRTPGSNGDWVNQGKKLQVGLSSAPTLYGFLNTAIGPAVRIRYTVAPLFNFQWSPAASISSKYAAALADLQGTAPMLLVPSTMTASVGLSQTWEGKVHPPAKDTTTDRTKWPNKKLLSLSSSPMSYDFEQAKLPGRTGWTTAAFTNSVQSDLLPGIQLSLTHDLWQGQVGTDTAKFDPFLSNVQANFSITGHLLHNLGAIFGLVHRDTVKAGTGPVVASAPVGAASGLFSPSSFSTPNAVATAPAGHGFSASISYSLSRSRPIGNTAAPVSTLTNTGLPTDPFAGLPLPAVALPQSQSNIGLNMSFSPTPFWSVVWQTQYDATTHQFASQQIQLQRDLHDWRASFNFVKSPNGNFALYFSIFLINLPDIKGDYNQTTIHP